jgi:hypothetical protein
MHTNHFISSGFDKILLADQPAPFKFVPRAGQHLTVTFGNPATLGGRITEAIDSWRERNLVDQENLSNDYWKSEVQTVRSRITRIVQGEVEALGRPIEEELRRSNQN